MSSDAILIVAALTAFALSALLSAAALPVLKKLKAAQTVLGYVEKHAKKSGTPTMGGIAFVLVTAIVVFVFCESHVAKVAAGAMLGFGLIGFLDDAIKVVFRRNLGLKAYQKIVGQAGVTAIMVAYGYRLDGGTVAHIPFAGTDVDLGVWYIPLAALAYVGTVNCVNLTDGLDGLAAGTGTVYFAVLGIVCTMTSTAGDGQLATMAFALAGAMTAFLWFNSNPAQMFMGDTGSRSGGVRLNLVAQHLFDSSRRHNVRRVRHIRNSAGGELQVDGKARICDGAVPPSSGIQGSQGEQDSRRIHDCDRSRRRVGTALRGDMTEMKRLQKEDVSKALGVSVPDGKRALIVGAGKSGKAAKKLLTSVGIECALYDDGEHDEWEDDRSGMRANEVVEGIAFAIVSPSVPSAHPLIAERCFPSWDSPPRSVRRAR